jgi:diguanylate cyclase (GGDEF)-like protein
VHQVLVAEDDPLYRRAVQHLLSGKGYDVECVTDGMKALEAAMSGAGPRLLILDWMMPGLQGPEICRRIREHRSTRYRYILLLTSRHMPGDIVEGLGAGADDYLIKPFNSHELLARVRVGERLLRLHDGLVAAQEALRFQATHDPLTGLWNRKALFELLKAELERAGRKRQPISVMLVDVDHFKRVNDECGHLAGDAILQEIANRLTAAVRPYDLIGRYGGEEFIISASELDLDSAAQLAERLRGHVASKKILGGDVAIQVTVSVGVATTVDPQCCLLEALVQGADEAMYRAKRSGRNRVEASLIQP